MLTSYIFMNAVYLINLFSRCTVHSTHCHDIETLRKYCPLSFDWRPLAGYCEVTFPVAFLFLTDVLHQERCT